MSEAATKRDASRWPFVSLGSICQVIAGQSPPGSAYNSEGQGLPFYQGKKEFTDRFLGPSTKWTTEVTRAAEPEDILMSVRAPVGPINEATETVCIGRGLAAIRAGDNLDQGFLWYALLWLQPEITGSAGAVFPSINRKQIESLVLPCPSLEEQKRIVAILDQAFAALDRARAHAETNLADASLLLTESRERLLDPLQQGWCEKPLSQMVRIKHGFAFKSDFFTARGEYVLLTPGNFHEGGGYRDRAEKQKYYAGPLPEGFLLQEGDLLMAMTEQAPGLLGSCILVPEGGRFLHNQRLGLIQAIQPEAWHSPFFAHVFNTKGFRKAIADSCAGVKVRHTSPDKICAVRVPVPPSMDVQIDVANALDHLSRQVADLRNAYQAKLTDIATLRQSLLQQAFSGQLT